MRRGANLALERLVDVRRPPEAVVQRPSDFAVAIGVRSREVPAPRDMADSARCPSRSDTVISLPRRRRKS